MKIPNEWKKECERCGRKLKHVHIFEGEPYGCVCVKRVKNKRQKKFEEGENGL